MIDKNNDPHGDGTVRNIEGRPVIFSDVKVEKVHHHSKADSIYQISDRATEYQSKTDCQKSVPMGRLDVEIKNQAHGQRRNKEKYNRPEDRAHFGHQSECTARIENMGDIKNTFDNRDAFVQPQIYQDERLGDLVGRNNKASHDCQPYEFVMPHLIHLIQCILAALANRRLLVEAADRRIVNPAAFTFITRGGGYADEQTF